MLGRDGKLTYHAIELNLANTTAGWEPGGSGSGGSKLDVLAIAT
jgi:hypothetical protein